MFEENADIAAFKAAHKASDVDAEPSSQHHTLGKGPTQAAPGNHGHTTYSVQAEPPDRPAVGDEWVVTDLDNLRREWDGFTWVDRKLGLNAVTSEVGEVQPGSITGTHIANDAISAPHLAANSVGASEIVANAIDGMQITGALIRTSANSNRIELDGYNNVLRGYYGGETMFELNANNGQVTAIGSFYTDTYPNSRALLATTGLFFKGTYDSHKSLLTHRYQNPVGNAFVIDTSESVYVTNALRSSSVIHGNSLTSDSGLTLQGSQNLNRIKFGEEHVSVNASGVGSISHGLGTTPVAFIASSAAGQVNVVTLGSSSVTIELFSSAGSSLSNTSRKINWIAVA